MFVSTYSLQCIRHVCPDIFEVFEDCVGLYATDKTTAHTLTQLIKDACFLFPFLWNVVVGSVMTVPATCLVEYPVLQLKFSRLNQELLSSLQGTLSQPCCPRDLPFHKVMADTFDTVLELGKV